MKEYICSFFLTILIVRVLASEEYVVPPAYLDPSPYPEWAHHHWVWLDNSRATQPNIVEYVKEYLARNITVGAVNLDSGWSTGYNNFIFDTKKYPNATYVVEHFHSLNIRVILWVTSVIDTTSSNYQEGHDKGYFLKDIVGREAIIDWWYGKGGMLDYTNPDAVDWWHKQMDQVIDLGIDGWKCDGTDPYVLLIPDAIGKSGHVSRRQYSDDYYNDFFDYIRRRAGRNDTLIMSRPVDAYGPIYLDFSPKRVMLSGWVGDQDPTFEGLQNCLKRYLQSAWAGYANFGSDIGGYRSGSGTLGRTKELFIRWAQLGAFSPLMENGGDKEHRPWMFDNTNETLNIYRKAVDDHYQLVPYFLTIGADALKKGTSAMIPLAKHESFIDKVIDLFKPDTYNYLLGQSFLVAPIVSDANTVEVTFPEGQWVPRWNSSIIYKGGEKVSFPNLPLNTFPVFVRTNTIVPLRITPMTPVLGNFPHLHGNLRLLLYYPEHTPYPVKSSVVEDSGPGLEATHWMDTAGVLYYNITAHPTQKVVLQVIGCQLAKPDILLVSEGGCYPLKKTEMEKELVTNTWYYVSSEEELFVYVESVKKGASLTYHCT